MTQPHEARNTNNFNPKRQKQMVFTISKLQKQMFSLLEDFDVENKTDAVKQSGGRDLMDQDIKPNKIP